MQKEYSVKQKYAFAPTKEEILAIRAPFVVAAKEAVIKGWAAAKNAWNLLRNAEMLEAKLVLEKSKKILKNTEQDKLFAPDRENECDTRSGFDSAAILLQPMKNVLKRYFPHRKEDEGFFLPEETVISVNGKVNTRIAGIKYGIPGGGILILTVSYASFLKQKDYIHKDDIVLVAMANENGDVLYDVFPNIRENFFEAGTRAENIIPDIKGEYVSEDGYHIGAAPVFALAIEEAEAKKLFGRLLDREDVSMKDKSVIETLLGERDTLLVRCYLDYFEKKYNMEVTEKNV